MYLSHKQGKLSFLIGLFTSIKDEITGGVIVMHKLAYELAKRDFNVYIFCEPAYPHDNITVLKSSKLGQDGFVSFFSWEPFSYPLYSTVSIFPQTTRGNWFNTPNVTRWLLYDTEKEIEATFKETDVYYNFGTFKSYRESNIKQLTVFDFNKTNLYKTNFGNRKTFCHIIHKHTPIGGEKIFEILGSENITDWRNNGGYNYLREKLNEYEYFLTYDQKSFYTVSAGLCGTKSIILNPGPSYEFASNAYSESEEYQKKMQPLEFRLKNPYQMFGVSYGWDDLDWAKKTIDLVPNYIDEYEKMLDKTVDEFCDFWIKKVYG